MCYSGFKVGIAEPTIVVSNTAACSWFSSPAKCFWSSSLALDGWRPAHKNSHEILWSLYNLSSRIEVSVQIRFELHGNLCTCFVWWDKTGRNRKRGTSGQSNSNIIWQNDMIWEIIDIWPSILSQSLCSCCRGQLSHCWLWALLFCWRAATENACFKVNMISSTWTQKSDVR